MLGDWFSIHYPQRSSDGVPFVPVLTPALNGIAATMFHDEGAIAQCGECGRYTLNRLALSDKVPPCECGSKHGWSGSFKKPGPEAKWSGLIQPGFWREGGRQMLTEQDERDCLQYDFDADSKGDSGVKVLGRKMVKAAKDYPEGVCFPCAGPIAKGERHRVERGLMDGSVRTCRTCEACCAAMAAYRGDDFEAIERRYSKGREWHEAQRNAGVDTSEKEQPK